MRATDASLEDDVHASAIRASRHPSEDSSAVKVLVIGGGGREHALVWGLSRSPRVSEIVCAPGNAGIRALAAIEPLDVTDIPTLVALAGRHRPDLVVIGPEVPLALGAADALQALGLRVFGPTQAAARLESSKVFAKDFMRVHAIPTARSAFCTTIEQVEAALPGFSVPVVVKADGLAAGKGVVIANTHREALHAAGEIFSGTLLGAAQTEIVLEEFLPGEELSFFALCDGATAVPIAAAQDHKRLGEGDTGPNTGGMGAYSTDELLSPLMRDWLTTNVAQKVVDGMRAEGDPFRGILFCGMMLVPQPDGTVSPMVLEFNTRWGDPETECILLRLETDLLDLFDAAVDGTADQIRIRLKPDAAAVVIAASPGYPGQYPTGLPIHGLDQVPHLNSPALNSPAFSSPDVVVFHAGTALRPAQHSQPDEIVTAGGRVLAVAAAAPTLTAALDRCYATLAHIRFEGMQIRRDIGHRALAAGR